jgi:UDP-N-acetylglucosamine acyltransferase
VTNRIHSTAVLGPQVELGERNVIGPYCVLQGPVRLGDDNFLSAHVVVGAAAEVAGLPFLPSWEDETEEGGVEIGSRNVLKELVSVNTGWHSVTRIGDDCLLMNGTYLAHDTQTEDRVTISSGVRVGGHSVLENDATLGMGATVHQRRVVGAGAMVGMSAAVSRDVAPFTVARGVPARSTRLNHHRLRALGVGEEHHDRLRAVVLEGSRDLTGLPDVLRTPIEAWWSRQADA